MPPPEIVPARADYADFLAPRLRAADRAEPLSGLRRALGLSTLSRAIVAGGEPIALFGFAPLNESTAAPWLLANTSRIVRSGDYLWSRFWNLVDTRNVKHVRWLRWAGFTVGDPVPAGPFGLPFHPFSRAA